MTESKKAWVEPELIVLVRSKAEEAVLAACKNGDYQVGGNSSANRECYVALTGCGIECSVFGAS